MSKSNPNYIYIICLIIFAAIHIISRVGAKISYNHIFRLVELHFLVAIIINSRKEGLLICAGSFLSFEIVVNVRNDLLRPRLRW